jgi:hypothetical protein
MSSRLVFTIVTAAREFHADPFYSRNAMVGQAGAHQTLGRPQRLLPQAKMTGKQDRQSRSAIQPLWARQ